MNDKTIVVLGVGNVLMKDDGIGVKAVRALGSSYELPERVCLIDGGVAAFACLEAMSTARHLLIVDAVRNGGPPGSLCRTTPAELVSRKGPTISPHEFGLTEILGMASMLGPLPPTLILGVNPAVTDEPGLELSDPLQRALPSVCAAIADELRALDVAVSPRRFSELSE